MIGAFIACTMLHVGSKLLAPLPFKTVGKETALLLANSDMADCQAAFVAVFVVQRLLVKGQNISIDFDP